MSENSIQVNKDAEVTAVDPKKKPHQNTITKDLVHLIDGDTDFLPPELRSLNYPFRYKCYQTRPRDGNTYLKVAADNSLVFISKEEMAEEIYLFLTFNLTTKEQCHYKPSYAEALQLVTCWPAYQKKIRVLPPAMGWSETPGLVMRRLPFTKIAGMTDTKLEQLCPEFAQILGRMENAAWFVWRVGSLFDPLADRKQAAYVWGPPDCGKSQLQSFFKWLGDSSYTSMTCVDLKGEFWKDQLLGARICCVAEAASDFLNNAAFLAITGDSYHSINVKKIRAFMAEINTMFFFFSNEPPKIESRPEVQLRVASCKMESLKIDESERINEFAYQERLKGEAQAFLSYCCEYYSLHKGLRHSSDMSTLEEASCEKESWAMDIFDRYFEPSDSPKDRMSSSDFWAILTHVENLNQTTALKCTNIFERRYGIKKKKSNGVRIVTNIKLKPKSGIPLNDAISD